MRHDRIHLGRTLLAGLSLLFLVGLQPGPRADLIVSDDFDYPDGDFDGSQNGGASFDANNRWTGAWIYTGGTAGGTTSWNIVSQQLWPIDHPVFVGNDAISRTFNENHPPDTTLYFTYVLDWQTDFDDDYIVMLEFTTLFRIGLVSDQIRVDMGPGGAFFDSQTTGVLPPGRRTLVGRVDFDSGPLAAETLTLWIDPNDELDAPALVASAETFRRDLGTAVTFRREDELGNLLYIDDFKLGTDFNFSLPADPALTKSVMPDVLLSGSSFFYTLRVTNNILVDAFDVRVFDLLPP
ncbi:MAG: hypothetical protein AAF492_30765, partial [Verrucomicrobiota bacterium]